MSLSVINTLIQSYDISEIVSESLQAFHYKNVSLIKIALNLFIALSLTSGSRMR
jgi:hypothetical protein